MKRTQRYENRAREAREGDLILVMRWYSEEIEKERSRQRSSRNRFIRECCQQTIDQLSTEKRAIEEELVG